MKLIKYFSILALVGLIAACSHGYEGKYQGKFAGNELMNSFMGTSEIVIGSDFIEADGERSKFDKIFVRKTGKDQYLVFQSKSGEEAWKIQDKNTLLQSAGGLNMEFVRVK